MIWATSSIAAGALLLAAASAHGESAPPTKRYAVVIGNNTSLVSQLQPLLYADDDAAKFHELFDASQTEVTLLAVLDPDAQQRFPAATLASRPPTRETLLEVLNDTFTKIASDRDAGIETEFYFVYSGHGNVGPNREGYLHLLDAPFTRRDLYHELLARSPATWNHIVLDACNARFVVAKRGGQDHRAGNYRDAVLALLQTEELKNYPNTGVVLASSSQAESHEWGLWGSGLFSHQLRSGMLGAADLDRDGELTYAEVAGFVQAANSAVTDPRARLQVFARPPPARINKSLFKTALVAATGRIRFDGGDNAHYHVEDARGVRVADLHPGPNTEVSLALLGERPFFLRDARREAVVAQAASIPVSHLKFSTRALSSKGSLQHAFSGALFSRPFGHSFFEGMMAIRGPAVPRWDGWYGSSAAEAEAQVSISVEAESRTTRTQWAFASLGGAAGAAAGGALFGYWSRQSFDKYKAAKDDAARNRHKRKTRQQGLTANILFGAAGGLALCSAVLFLLGDDASDGPSASFYVADQGVVARAGIHW